MTRTSLPSKVLHIELGERVVGGPQQVIYLLEGLAARSIESVLVALEGRPLARQVAGLGTRVRGVRWRGDTDMSLLPQLLAIIAEEKPDVVHLHARPGSALGALAARLSGVSVVLSYRVDNPPRGLFSRWIYETLNDRIICISRAVFDVLARHGIRRDRLVLVRSSVKAGDWVSPASREEFLETFGLPDGVPAIGVIAQLVGRKGHKYLLQAVAAGVGVRPRIIFFGEGRDETELRRLADELELGDAVVFAGHRDDLPKWIGNLDLVVHPASMEGLGVAILQAGSAAVATIGSAAGGIPEAIVDGVTGRLVSPGNVEELRSALIELLADGDRRRAMGEAAQRRMLAEFDVATMVDRHIEIYQELIRAG